MMQIYDNEVRPLCQNLWDFKSGYAKALPLFLNLKLDNCVSILSLCSCKIDFETECTVNHGDWLMPRVILIVLLTDTKTSKYRFPLLATFRQNTGSVLVGVVGNSVCFDMFAINWHICGIFNDNSLHNIKVALKITRSQLVFWRVPMHSLLQCFSAFSLTWNPLQQCWLLMEPMSAARNLSMGESWKLRSLSYNAYQIGELWSTNDENGTVFQPIQNQLFPTLTHCILGAKGRYP